MRKIIIVAALAAGSAYALSIGAQKITGVQAVPPVAGSTPAGRTDARVAGAATDAPADDFFPGAKVSSRCTVIASLPHAIRAPGRYCYAADLESPSVNGLSIEASDVSLDCRGFRTTSALPRTPGSDGIYTVGAVRNVTIRNCRVTGFDRGITAFAGAVGARILDNHVDAAQTVGIGAWGDGAQVVGNRVTNTSPAQAGQYSNGISLLPRTPEIAATGQALVRNVVVNVYGSPQSTGILVYGSAAPLIKGNTVMALRPTFQGVTAGIFLGDWQQGARTTAAQVIENQIMNRSSGYTDFAAQTTQSVATCLRNVSVGVAFSALQSCPSGSGNTTAPID